MLVQQLQPQLLRPPVAVRPTDAGDVAERALARALILGLRVHVSLRSCFVAGLGRAAIALPNAAGVKLIVVMRGIGGGYPERLANASIT
jgi:hypothetical protein